MIEILVLVIVFSVLLVLLLKAAEIMLHSATPKYGTIRTILLIVALILFVIVFVYEKG